MGDTMTVHATAAPSVHEGARTAGSWLTGSASASALRSLVERGERADDAALRRQAASVRRLILDGDLDPVGSPSPWSGGGRRFVDLIEVVQTALRHLPCDEQILIDARLPADTAPVHLDPERLASVLYGVVTLVSGDIPCTVSLEVTDPADDGHGAAVASVTISAATRRLSVAELARHTSALAETTRSGGPLTLTRTDAEVRMSGPAVSARTSAAGTTLKATWPVDLG